MQYTYSITSKGQITIPKELRERLGLDKTRRATIRLNEQNEIVVTAPKSLAEIRTMLRSSSFKDQPSEKEASIGKELARKYDVR